MKMLPVPMKRVRQGQAGSRPSAASGAEVADQGQVGAENRAGPRST